MIQNARIAIIMNILPPVALLFFFMYIYVSVKDKCCYSSIGEMLRQNDSICILITFTIIFKPIQFIFQYICKDLNGVCK